MCVCLFSLLSYEWIFVCGYVFCSICNWNSIVCVAVSSIWLHICVSKIWEKEAQFFFFFFCGCLWYTRKEMSMSLYFTPTFCLSYIELWQLSPFVLKWLFYFLLELTLFFVFFFIYKLLSNDRFPSPFFIIIVHLHYKVLKKNWRMFDSSRAVFGGWDWFKRNKMANCFILENLSK